MWSVGQLLISLTNLVFMPRKVVVLKSRQLNESEGTVFGVLFDV